MSRLVASPGAELHALQLRYVQKAIKISSQTLNDSIEPCICVVEGHWPCPRHAQAFERHRRAAVVTQRDARNPWHGQGCLSERRRRGVACGVFLVRLERSVASKAVQSGRDLGGRTLCVLEVTERHGLSPATDHPVQRATYGLGVCRVALVAVVSARHVMHEEVVVAFDDGGPFHTVLMAQYEEQVRLWAETLLELFQQFGHAVELGLHHCGADEKHRATFCIDSLETFDAALVLLDHARILRIVVPKRVQSVAVHDHVLDPWHRLLRDVIEESVEILSHVMQDALQSRPRPVERQRLRASPEVLEGQLTAAVVA
mmetsp:Transcript_70081/g.194826  ORF Transcript_70081/g.194826 Transcript_70081/m.194826 type:complete len:315 (+) Transcript_70081:616-1560(+)